MISSDWQVEFLSIKSADYIPLRSLYAALDTRKKAKLETGYRN
jgi:hypothetical protein